MDRMVDHLFAFEGDGVIRDFPGNYSQYREAIARETTEKDTAAKTVRPEITSPAPAVTDNNKKLSFKEKREFEQLESDIPALEREKAVLEKQMNEGTLSYDELQSAANRIGVIISLLDEKEMRWLELSERV